MFKVYILWSKTKRKFYVGFTKDIDDRLARHNGGRSTSTKAGAPWILVLTENHETRSLAILREKQIKGWKSSDQIRKLIGDHPDL